MARKSRNKPVLFKVVIVGEGPTEWFYFSDMKQNEKFGFEIKPDLPQHSDYKSIIKTARQKRDDGFDLVFCVLDMDRIVANPTEFRGYFSEKAKKNKNHRIIFIESMPCIELWFLLHFLADFSLMIFESFSSLNPVLKKWIPGYEKTEKYLKKRNLYTYLIKHGDLPKAMEFASRLNEIKGKSEEKNFNYTQINILITELFGRKVNS